MGRVKRYKPKEKNVRSITQLAEELDRRGEFKHEEVDNKTSDTDSGCDS